MQHTLYRWSLCAFVLVACGSDENPMAEPTVSATGDLRVLSYNVAGLPESFSSSMPTMNTPLISPLLNGFELVLVQEDWLTPDPNPFGLEVYHALLAADATHPHQSEPAPLPGGQDAARPEALMSDGLNRFSQASFGELTRVRWDGCFGGADGSDMGAGDCLAIKGFSVATHTLAQGVEVDVYNLHGEAGATDTDQQLSADGFLKLAAFIEEAGPGRAILLAGDTNLHTGDGHPDGHGEADLEIWTGLLEATGLTDVCDVIDPCEDGIDKMAFRSSDAVILEPLSHDYPREDFVRDDGEPLSDHPPLVVDLAWSLLGE